MLASSCLRSTRTSLLTCSAGLPPWTFILCRRHQLCVLHNAPLPPQIKPGLAAYLSTALPNQWHENSSALLPPLVMVADLTSSFSLASAGGSIYYGMMAHCGTSKATSTLLFSLLGNYMRLQPCLWFSLVERADIWLAMAIMCSTLVLVSLLSSSLQILAREVKSYG